MAPQVRNTSKEQGRWTSDRSNISQIQKSGGGSTKRGKIPRKRVVSGLPGNGMKTRSSLRSSEPSVRACRAAPLENVGTLNISDVEERMEALMDNLASAKLAEINGYVCQEMNDIGQNLSSVLDNLLRTELVDFKAGVLSQLNTLVAAQVADEVAEIRREAATSQQKLMASVEARVRAVEEEFARQLTSRAPVCPVTSAGMSVAVQVPAVGVPSMAAAGTGRPPPPGGADESAAILQRLPHGMPQEIAKDRSPCNRKQGRAPAADPASFDLNVRPGECDTGEDETQRVTRSMRRAASRNNDSVDLKRLGCLKGVAHDEQVPARWCLPGVFTRSRSLAVGSHKRAKHVSSSRHDGARVPGEGREAVGMGAGDGGGAAMETGVKNKISKGDMGRRLGDTQQHTQVEGGSSEKTVKLGDRSQEISMATSPSQLLCRESALLLTPPIHLAPSSARVERSLLHVQMQGLQSDTCPGADAEEEGKQPHGSSLLVKPSEHFQKLPIPLDSPADGEVMPIPEAPTKGPRPGGGAGAGAGAGGGAAMEAPGAEAVVGTQGPGGRAGLAGEVKQHLEILHFGTTCLPSPYLASETGGVETSGSFQESEYGSRKEGPGSSRKSEGLFPCLCRFCSPTFVEGGEEVECSAKDTAFRPRVIGSRICPAACFLDGGQGVLLAAEDGSCRYYDAVSWEERVQYLLPPGLALPPVAGCWLVSAPWLNTESTPLVVVTSAVGPAFCSWHFHTGVLAGHSALASCHADASCTTHAESCPSVGCGCASCRHPTPAAWGDFVAPTWWAVPSGALLGQGRAGWADVQLTDLRDGAKAGEAKLGTPLAKLRHSSPLQWADKKRLLVAERGGVGLWEVKGGGLRLAKLVEVAFGESVTALTTIGAPPAQHRGRNEKPKRQWDISLANFFLGVIADGSQPPRPPAPFAPLPRSSPRRWSSFEGAFCTERAVYVLDWRTPTAVHLKIPYTEARPADCLYLSDCQILAGVGGEPYEESTRILEWECGNGEAIDDFLLEKRTPGADRGAVTQVWAGNGKVLGVHAGGLYIFQETPKYGQRPDDDSRLLAVVGRGLKGGLLSPKFYGDGDRVLLLSANHEPRMYTGV